MTALCLLMATSRTHATGQHGICVDSVAALQGALDDASDLGTYNGDDNFIRIVHGTYPTGADTGHAAFHYSSTAATGGLFLAGGYQAGCGPRTPKYSPTILSGNGLNRVLVIHSKVGAVDVSSLVIEEGETSGDGGGLSINAAGGDAGAVSVRGNIIRNSHAAGYGGGILVSASGSGNELTVQNNLIVGNSADLGYGAGLTIANGSAAYLHNNTVAENTTIAPGVSGGLSYTGGVHGSIVNNIFWNNTNAGFYVGTTDVSLDYNDYGSIGGLPPGESTGNVSVAPQFVDKAGGDFHLAGDSPLLAASPQAFLAEDPDGYASAATGRMDLGAYFETIFADGFSP
jgi:hypothetical protein